MASSKASEACEEEERLVTTVLALLSAALGSLSEAKCVGPSSLSAAGHDAGRRGVRTLRGQALLCRSRSRRHYYDRCCCCRCWPPGAWPLRCSRIRVMYERARWMCTGTATCGTRWRRAVSGGFRAARAGGRGGGASTTPWRILFNSLPPPSQLGGSARAGTAIPETRETTGVAYRRPVAPRAAPPRRARPRWATRVAGRSAALCLPASMTPTGPSRLRTPRRRRRARRSTTMPAPRGAAAGRWARTARYGAAAAG